MSLKFVDVPLSGETVVVGGASISTLKPGRVFRQNDITETQMKNTLMLAVTCCISHVMEERKIALFHFFQGVTYIRGFMRVLQMDYKLIVRVHRTAVCNLTVHRTTQQSSEKNGNCSFEKTL